MTATQTVYLNQTEYRVPPVIHAVQNDTGRKVKMVIQDQVLPSGSTATLNFMRSDKSHYSVTCEAFVSADNSFTAEIDQALTQAGITECQLKVSGIVSTFTFIIDVQPDVSGISVQQDGYSAEQIIEIIDSKGITEDIKQTLLACFAKVAWIDDQGQDYYDALYDALYPPRTLLSISCVYMQSGTVYAGDSLDDLKPDLTVTAHYEDGGSEVVTDYYLSGTLYEGESTITVTYGGKTTTFDVQVVTLVSISAVYTQTGTVYDTESLDDLREDLVVVATYNDSSTKTVTDYELSGTLTEGTSTITVSYGGKSTTFNVVVTHTDLPVGYTKYDYLTLNIDPNTQAKAYGIWTDAQMSTDYTLEMKAYFPSGTYNMVSPPLFGTRASASGAKEIALFYRPRYGNLGYWFDGTDTVTNNIPSPSQDTVHSIKIQPVGVSESYPTKATIRIDDTDYDTGSSSTGKMFDSWFGIFTYAISATNGITNNDVVFLNQQIGEITATDSNGVLVYDFVPAKDSSNKYGFYEKVNDVFYYNTTYAETGYIGGYWE